MSVATPPRRASLIAASASAPTVSALVDSCTQRETLRATPTMSDASGGVERLGGTWRGHRRC